MNDFIVWCALCRFKTGVVDGKKAGKAVLRAAGWRKNEKRGWFCPKCAGIRA